MKKFGHLLDQRGIDWTRDEPLHSRVGKYRRALDEEMPTHEMARQIVRNSIALFDRFNDVRNNWTLAHDNALLRQAEARFVFDSVVAVLRFVKAVETRILCNPRGYVGYHMNSRSPEIEVAAFDPELVVEVVRRLRPIPAGFEVEEGYLTQNGIPIGRLDEALDELEREDAERERQLAEQIRANGRVSRMVGDLTDEEMRMILAARSPDDLDGEEPDR
ncbi:abortive infection family protein [Aureimonas mangrovi]|uniref:abortive infection family protein n=1 Tax=Aureimonas mangrovi TaxID=2758041 RepID=UPI00163D6D91|nr:abortive infection family protein [Aureimonas mangrovi]